MQTLPQTDTETDAVTQAYVAAENIESFNVAAFLLVAASAAMVLLASAIGEPAFRLLGVIPAAASVRIFFIVARWFRTFGSYRSEDPDFVSARRKVRYSLWLWRAAIVTQVLGVFMPI
jgi:hypothetical protein